MPMQLETQLSTSGEPLRFKCIFLSLCLPAKVIQQVIPPAQYEDVVGDDMINLAVVLEDTTNQEQFLATEEFNIASPELNIKVFGA